MTSIFYAPPATPDLPVLVIAGDFDQALKWLYCERPEKFFIAEIGADIIPLRNVRVVWVGTFYDRSDFLDLCDDVDLLVSAGRIVVDRNEIVNKGRKARPKTDPEGGAGPRPLS